MRDVLDAVGARSSSPSVFYYYFPSKDELYRTVVATVAHEYVAGFENAFALDGKDIEERLCMLVEGMRKGLGVGGGLITLDGPSPNRLFVLDMREQVTQGLAVRWSEFLAASRLCEAGEADAVALFITGGMGQLLFSYLIDGQAGREHEDRLLERIASLTMAALGLPDDVRASLMGALRGRESRGRGRGR